MFCCGVFLCVVFEWKVCAGFMALGFGVSSLMGSWLALLCVIGLLCLVLVPVCCWDSLSYRLLLVFPFHCCFSDQG